MKIAAFAKHNPKHHANLLNWPEEDSFKYKLEKDKITVTVADGITRDPLNFSELPDYHTLLGKIEFAVEYPIPSPARKAADAFCTTIEKAKNIKQLFQNANEKIKQLNKGLKVDYLQNDFAACVASAGIIHDKNLHYSYICDCGVCIFDKNGKLKFKTKNEGPNPKIGKEISKNPEKYGTGWKDPRWRARTRSHYRNNPKEPLAYGALTGEKAALKYIKTGIKKLNSGDL